MNLYEYVGSNPVSRTDLLGLDWDVQRNGEPRAVAKVVDSSDTISQLARKVRLEVGEFNKWIKLEGFGKILTEQGEKALWELTLADKICPGEKVTVPNTAYVNKGNVRGELLGNIMTERYNLFDLLMTLELYDIESHFKELGYKTIRVNIATPWILNYEFSSQDIVAWAYAGHGIGGWLLLGEPDMPELYDADNAISSLHHKLAEVIIITCQARLGNWDRIISYPFGVLRASAEKIPYTIDWEDLPTK